MNITIVGGGNIGTQFAVHCAEKQHDVVIFSSNPKCFQKHLSIVDDNGVIIHEGDISYATNDPEKAFGQADLILVTFPATLMNMIAEIIFEYSTPNAIIGVVPGNGGSECAFKKCIDRGNIFFGIERVPAIARLIEKGKTVRSIGYRRELHVSAIPMVNAYNCAKIVQNIFDIPCKVIPCYLNLTMTPSNPILHTTRLKTIFRDYYPGVSYDEVPLFYEEWDNESSELLIACDDEVQKICKALPEFKLIFVKSLKEHYESPDICSMTRKISGILAFKGLKTPTINIDGRLIPDFHSRYFTADFSYGLNIIRQVAVFADVCVPNIDDVLKWYESIAIEKGCFNYKEYGIRDLNDLRNFYLQ